MDLIKNLKWRYATKKFDANRRISNKDIALLKEAIQLSVSSYGLQLYKVLIITDPELRKKLRPVSWNQAQITDCSHLFVFCHYKKAEPSQIDSFIKRTVQIRNWELEPLQGYGAFIKEKVAEKSLSEQHSWLRSQTYLALGNLLNACAELKIDACPMEGFEVEAYNKLLNLNEKGLSAAVITPVGYRSEDDHSSQYPKVRIPIAELFEEK